MSRAAMLADQREQAKRDRFAQGYRACPVCDCDWLPAPGQKACPDCQTTAITIMSDCSVLNGRDFHYTREEVGELLIAIGKKLTETDDDVFGINGRAWGVVITPPQLYPCEGCGDLIDVQGICVECQAANPYWSGV